MKEEDGIINKIIGTKHHKTSIQQYIIEYQQIGEFTTTTHGIEGRKKFQLLAIKD